MFHLVMSVLRLLIVVVVLSFDHIVSEGRVSNSPLGAFVDAPRTDSKEEKRVTSDRKCSVGTFCVLSPRE